MAPRGSTDAGRVAGQGELRLGATENADRVAELVTELATLVRLRAGRHPDPARFRLDGADPGDCHLFR